jgi:hypothetical protein
MRWGGLGILAVATALAGPVAAQTGSLRVVVTDAGTKAALRGATVVLDSETRQVAPTRALTDASGSVVFPVLRAGGGYTVEVGLHGYAVLRLPDVRVPPGGAAVLPVALFPALAESVDVRARSEGVDLDDATTSTTFTSEFTEDLPIYGRFYQTLLTMAPGVLDSDGDGNPNVLGARATDFKTVVGGVANTDPLTGGFLSYLSLESVEALEVVTAGAGVAFGRAQGGFANLVQKQGSNDFEGVAGFLWGSSLLDGNGAAEGEVPEFDRFQPYVQVSGPIVEDRLWYRLSHEWIRRDDPVNVLSGVALTHERQDIHSDQLTWQVSPRNKMTLQVARDPLQRENVGLASGTKPESSYSIRRGGNTTSLTWTVPHSANLFAEGLVALQEHREELFPTETGVDNACSYADEWTNLGKSRCTDDETGAVSGSWQTDSRDLRRRSTVRGQVTYSPGGGGRVAHRFQAGLSVENERYFRHLFRGIDGVLLHTNPFEWRAGVYFAEMYVPGETRSRAVGSGSSVFLEDQVRLGSRWSVTAGLRVDREEISAKSKEGFDPAAEAARFRELLAGGVQAPDAMEQAFTGFDGKEDFQLELGDVLGVDIGNISPLLEQSSRWPRKRRLENVDLAPTTLSPRLAVTWDPWGSGKTKIAATAGRYYDKVFLSVPLLATESPTSAMSFATWYEIGFGWYAYRAAGGAENGRVTVVDPGLRTPYQDEITFSAEREILPETSVKVTWVHRRFRDQLQDVDVNHVSGDYGRCLLNFDLGSAFMVGSPGSGQTLLDPYSGRSYQDSDPGIGDGRQDDCTGEIVRPGGLLTPLARRPDGLPDLYALNPVWGQVMVVGNHNTADYSAALLEVVRRFAHGWGLQVSYTWSRAIGDAEAFDQLLGDEPDVVNEERSYLGYDQRHVVKVVGARDTKWGWRLGTAVRFESGLPYSVIEPVRSSYGLPPEYGLSYPLTQIRYRYPTGKRNDRRNPGFWNFDLRVSRELALRGSRTFGLTVEVFNLLNDDTLRVDRLEEGTVIGVRRFGRRFQLGLRSSF